MQKKYNEYGITAAFNYYDQLVSSAHVWGLVLIAILTGFGVLLGFPYLGVLCWSGVSIVIGVITGALISAKALVDIRSLKTDFMIPFVKKDVPYGH